MSEEQPQKNRVENGDNKPDQSQAMSDQIVLAFRSFTQKTGKAFRRTYSKLSKSLVNGKKTWTTSTWPKLKASLQKTGASFRQKLQSISHDSKTKTKEHAVRRNEKISAQELRARYDRQAGDKLPDTASLTNTTLPNDASAQAEATRSLLERGTESLKTRMAAMTASVRNAYGNRRQRSTMYKPYRYQGIGNRVKRHGRQKVYRLKGYTTVARVNRKRRREYIRRQRNVLIISVLIIVVIIMIFMWIDPVPKIRDLLQDLGFLTQPTA